MPDESKEIQENLKEQVSQTEPQEREEKTIEELAGDSGRVFVTGIGCARRSRG